MFPLLIAMAALSAVSAVNQTNDEAGAAQKELLKPAAPSGNMVSKLQSGSGDTGYNSSTFALENEQRRRTQAESDASLPGGLKPDIRDTMTSDSMLMPRESVPGGSVMGGLAYPWS